MSIIERRRAAYEECSTRKLKCPREHPASLHCLQDALSTAASCIACRVCPNKFLTAMQNAQIIKIIESDMAEAEGTCQPKLLQIGSTEITGHRYEHTSSMSRPSEHLVLELSPSEWGRLAKEVVKGEVRGISDVGGASFMSVMTTLEERQAHWHKMEPIDDCPDPERRRHDTHNHSDNPMCLMLTREAEKLVDLFALAEKNEFVGICFSSATVLVEPLVAMQ